MDDAVNVGEIVEVGDTVRVADIAAVADIEGVADIVGVTDCVALVVEAMEIDRVTLGVREFENVSDAGYRAISQRYRRAPEATVSLSRFVTSLVVVEKYALVTAQ